MGWPLELFVGEDKAREFECPICLEVIKHPKSLNCNHLFCTRCIMNWIHKPISINLRGPNCPVCRKEIKFVVPMVRQYNFPPSFTTYSTAMREVEIIHQEFLNQINGLEMKCVNASKGCNVRILYSQFEKHIRQDCQFRTKIQGYWSKLDLR